MRRERALATGAALALCGCLGEGEEERLVINEFMARSRFTTHELIGAGADWIELYNPGDQEVSLRGWSLTDRIDEPRRQPLDQAPAIAPGERVLLYASPSQPAGQRLDFELAAEGGELTLVGPSGAVVDQVSYGAQATDLAAARIPDGAGRWEVVWDASPGAANPGQAALSVASSDDAGAAPAAGEVSELLFGDDIGELALELSGAALDSLRAAPRTYVEGALRWRGRRLAPVGVRIKGKSSLRSIDDKPSLRIEMDHFVAGGELLGQDDLVLNNMIEDPTMMRERLSYQALRQYGLPAPRASHAWVTINGQDYGLYAQVENIEARMLARWFGDGSGPLYEGQQVDFLSGPLSGYDLSGVGADYAALISSRMVGPVASFEHDGGADDRAALLALAEALRGPLAPELGNLDMIDRDQFLALWMASAALGHFDGFPFSFNDYYVYVHPADRRLRFLPWGLDESLYKSDYWPFAGNALLARRCNVEPTCLARLIPGLWDAIARLEAMDLVGEHDRLRARIAGHVARDRRRAFSDAEVAAAQSAQRAYLGGRRQLYLSMGVPP